MQYQQQQIEDVLEQWISNDEHKDENAVYIEYQPEIAMNKLKNIQDLSYQERKIYTNHLSELLPIIGKDITNILSHTLKILSEDTHEIKFYLLKQIPDILKFLQGVEDSYEHIKDLILHPIFDMLGSPQLDIKEQAGQILSQAAHIFTEQDRGTYILKKVLEMARDDKNEENRMVAVQLYSKLAECFGSELCNGFVGLEFLMLGDDPQARVRKEAVINLPQISKVCAPEFFKTRLLPFYLKSCQDTQWGIRKACVDIIVELAKVSDVEDREKKLTQILTGKFLEDNNKWVKVAAYKSLGPFIATLKGCELNEQLFLYYNKMTEQSINYLSNGNEIMIACSYNFPAVLWTFGPQKWSDLKNTMYVLVKNKNKSVRKPIACSLHEIAEIIGQEKAEKDLFEVYDQVLKDSTDEVKFGAIKNWAKFLQVFDSERRENLVEILQTVQKDPKKWRIRQLIAKQIGKLTKFSNMNVIFNYIIPIATKLCNDTVSIVREEASKKMHNLVLKSIELQDEGFKIMIIEVIKAFSLSDKYSQRQVFVMICAKLMKHPQVFSENFLETFEKMATDKITNVRISVSKVLVTHIQKNGEMSKHERIQALVEQLRKDECTEIQRQLSYILPNVYQEKETSPKQQQQLPKQPKQTADRYRKVDLSQIGQKESEEEDVVEEPIEQTEQEQQQQQEKEQDVQQQQEQEQEQQVQEEKQNEEISSQQVENTQEENEEQQQQIEQEQEQEQAKNEEIIEKEEQQEEKQEEKTENNEEEEQQQEQEQNNEQEQIEKEKEAQEEKTTEEPVQVEEKEEVKQIEKNNEKEQEQEQEQESEEYGKEEVQQEVENKVQQQQEEESQEKEQQQLENGQKQEEENGEQVQQNEEQEQEKQEEKDEEIKEKQKEVINSEEQQEEQEQQNGESEQ